jgi:FSR family fosmidomycin resistance protein-like MFS transporter
MTSLLNRSVFLLALAHLTIELCGNFMPVLYPTLIKTLQLNYTQIGAIALVMGLSEALMQPLFGYLSDRWGAERMTILSMLWMGTILGLVGFTWSYFSLVLMAGVGVLGSAAFHPAGAVLVSTQGGTKRGTAVSIFSVGGNFGSALSPLLVALGVSLLGLPGTIVIIPFALLVSLILYWQFQQKGHTVTRPVHSQHQQHDRSAMSAGVKVGLTLIVLAVMTRSWVQVTLMTYMPEWIHSQTGSLTLGGQILGLFSIATGIGSLIGGNLSDRIGRWQVMALSLVTLGPAIWLFLHSTGFWQFLTVSLTGALLGLTFPVAVVLAQETWPQGIGFASALVMGLGWAPGGLGASFTGYIADHFSLDTGLQLLIFPPLFGLIGVLTYAALRRQATGSAGFKNISI